MTVLTTEHPLIWLTKHFVLRNTVPTGVLERMLALDQKQHQRGPNVYSLRLLYSPLVRREERGRALI